MTLDAFYLLTLGAGVLAYVGLTGYCIVTWIRRVTGRAAFGAALLTLLFLISLALIGIGPVSLTLEVLALLAWITLLVRIIGLSPGNARLRPLRPVGVVYGAAILLTGLLSAYAWVVYFSAVSGTVLPLSGLFAGELLLALCGLVLLEQVMRNTREDLRWRIRHMSIAMGTLFAFQLIHNACGLLFNGYMQALVVIQPAVFALAAPLVATASARNPRNPLRLNLSRRFVFGSGVLIATGVLLLVMGLLGYLVRALDGDWGAAALALITVVVAVATATILGSPAVRLRGRRWLEEHLFSSRYDYREEWRQVTGQLTEPSPDYNLPQQALRALSRILKSEAGAVWQMSSSGVLIPLGQWHTAWHQPLSPATSRCLAELFERHEWVLDLEALPPGAQHLPRQSPDLIGLSAVRFIVPLLTESRLFGIAALTEPPVRVSLNWEDDELLKLIARQAAGFIALREADRVLADADKLNGMNQVSAFLVHDVKTVSAQLSLLLQNAHRHKSNPAFIDDMLATVDNAVQRMQKLLKQLHEGRVAATALLPLNAELDRLVSGFAHQQPAPELRLPDQDVYVSADATQLRAALGHLVQNAIDAVADRRRGECTDTSVTIELTSDRHWAQVTITDTGPGMEQHFIDQVLFQPFTSTKGVAGMGVGAYQARTYARTLGGDVSVDSRPGSGTRFTIRLPVHEGP